MNLTIDQYINGFERSTRELASVLREWPEIDSELQDAYVRQLEWMLEVRAEVIRIAGLRAGEIVARIANVNAVLLRLRGPLAAVMGIEADLIVPATLATSMGAEDCGLRMAA